MPLLRTKKSLVNNRFPFLLLLTIAVSSLLLSGCSKGGGGNSLHVKSPAVGEKDLVVKSGYAFAVTKSFTDINQKITTAVTYNVHAANYDLDATNFGMTLEKPMASEDQLRLVFSLVGEEGTKDHAPIKAGTYSAKADKYMKVETVGIVTRKGNADTKTWFDRSSLTGQVNVTSVTDDSISGDIDVTAGDSAIKGSFTAKILKRK
ncbi:MAG TPA: hypothetical protein VGW32_09695 [Pyrinomonadaceae bacterium]|nr:hypothetical protein [Pyrinomonadaceae bacterium]